MECPNCGAELICTDYYGRGNHAAYEKYGYGWTKLGDIYTCPNREGFEDEADCMEYISAGGIDETLSSMDWNSWEDGCCSDTGYYTDQDGDLHEGYPC